MTAQCKYQQVLVTEAGAGQRRGVRAEIPAAAENGKAVCNRRPGEWTARWSKENAHSEHDGLRNRRAARPPVSARTFLHARFCTHVPAHTVLHARSYTHVPAHTFLHVWFCMHVPARTALHAHCYMHVSAPKLRDTQMNRDASSVPGGGTGGRKRPRCRSEQRRVRGSSHTQN